MFPPPGVITPKSGFSDRGGYPFAPARPRLRTNQRSTPVVTFRSALFWVRFVVASFTECSAIAYHVLQFRIFITVFDVVCCGCSDRQPVFIQASISFALFAEITCSLQNLLGPFLVPG